MKLLKWTGEGVPGGGTKSGGSEYWIGLTGVLRGETLVSVGQNILVLVALPLMEHLPGVHVVRVVLAAVSGQVHHEVRLEVDLFMTVCQAGVPGHPVPPAGLPLPAAGKVDVAQDEFDRPEAADVEHGVGVVLVLGPAVQQFVVSSLLPDDSLVEAGRVEDIARLQPQILPVKSFC